MLLKYLIGIYKVRSNPAQSKLTVFSFPFNSYVALILNLIFEPFLPSSFKNCLHVDMGSIYSPPDIVEIESFCDLGTAMSNWNFRRTSLESKDFTSVSTSAVPFWGKETGILTLRRQNFIFF